MIVELDVYSGRPNPTWSLSAGQIAELLEALQELPPADKLTGENALGYRGFLLSNPDRMGGLAPHIRIYGGVVTMDNGQVKLYRDIHNLEHQLLLQASQHGYDAIVDRVLERVPYHR